jgi:hypothetical protein
MGGIPVTVFLVVAVRRKRGLLFWARSERRCRLVTFRVCSD